MHCYHCGSPIPEGLKFCPQCGTPMEENEVLEEVTAEVETEEVAAEAPEVQEIPAFELFEEELERRPPALNDDVLFGLDEPVEEETEEEAEEAEEDEDGTLDPTSPDFDPRKFAGLDHEEFRPIAAAELLDNDDDEEEANEKKREKKKGRGGVVALIIALILVLLGAAGGLLYWLTMPVKEAVAEVNFAEFMDLQDGQVAVFDVSKRETNRFNRRDSLWCDVTVEDGKISTSGQYVMDYRLTGEGWKLANISELNTENWTVKPMAGASSEEIAAALTGQPIKFSDDYSYVLTAEDSAMAEIMEQNTDLEAGTDAVTVSVSGVEALVGWEVEVHVELTFDNAWKLTAMTHEEPELEFKPGMEFELTEEDFQDILVANPMPVMQAEEDVETTVVTDGEAAAAALTAAQTVKIAKSAVSELEVVQTVFNMEQQTQTVVVHFLLDKQVAKLEVDAALTFAFEDGWGIDSVTYAAKVKEINLDGEWKGVYPETAGKIPGVTLTIGKNEDGTDNNVFAFGPSETDPYFYTGKYYVEAVSDVDTLEVALNATDWVLYYNPGGVTMVDLKGVLMLDEAVITDGQNFRIALQRTVIETEEENVKEEFIAREVVAAESVVLTGVSVSDKEEEADLEIEDVTEPEAVDPDAVETVEPEQDTEPAEETKPAGTDPETEEAEPTVEAAPEDFSDVVLDKWDTPIG